MFSKTLTLAVLFFFLVQKSSAQVADTVGWSPPGATWVYRVFAASSSLSLQLAYVKDTIMLGKIARQMKTTEIRFIDINLTVRVVTDLGFEYYYNSNDSIYFYENGAFKFIYDFTPLPGDKWITGTNKVTCHDQGFPAQDTITVDSISKFVLGNRQFDFILNNSYSRKYVLGNVIKNIGSQSGPYPYANRNQCPSSGRLFEGLICYRDNIRGDVPIPNSSLGWCHSIITSINNPVSPPSFIIFPNPVKNTLFIKTIAGSKTTYSISDVSGRIMLAGKLLNNEIDVNGLMPGVYFITIIQKNKTINSRFVKL